LCEANKIFCASVSCNIGLFESPKLKYTFSSWIDERDYTRVLAEKISAGSYKKLSVVAAISIYHDTMVSAFLKSSTVKPVVTKRVLPDDLDFRTLITKIPDNTDSLLLLLPGDNAVQIFLKQWAQLKRGRPQVFTDDYILYAPNIEDIHKLGFQILYSEPEFDGTLLKPFEEKYKERFGNKPESPGAAVTYDTVKLLLGCIEKNGADPGQVSECFKATKNFKGYSGMIDFSGGHFALRSQMSVKQL